MSQTLVELFLCSDWLHTANTHLLETFTGLCLCSGRPALVWSLLDGLWGDHAPSCDRTLAIADLVSRGDSGIATGLCLFEVGSMGGGFTVLNEYGSLSSAKTPRRHYSYKNYVLDLRLASKNELKNTTAIKYTSIFYLRPNNAMPLPCAYGNTLHIISTNNSHYDIPSDANLKIWSKNNLHMYTCWLSHTSSMHAHTTRHISTTINCYNIPTINSCLAHSSGRHHSSWYSIFK